MFSHQIEHAQFDPLVTMLITLANWVLLIHLLRGSRWGAFWLGCFAAGQGVLTKGVGVIGLLMLLLPCALARWRGWQGLMHTAGDGWRWAGGAVALLAAIALWLVPMSATTLSRGTPEYLGCMQDILFNQTARRCAGQIGGREHKPFWYFLPVVLLHFFRCRWPASAAGAKAGAGTATAWRCCGAGAHSSSSSSAWLAAGARSTGCRCCRCWRWHSRRRPSASPARPG